MRPTGKRQPVDVGEPAIGPLVDVVGLAQITRNVAPRRRAAAILCVQDYPLIRGRDAPRAAEVQRALGVRVEDRQIVIRVRGHPDDVGHR